LYRLPSTHRTTLVHPPLLVVKCLQVRQSMASSIAARNLQPRLASSIASSSLVAL
jgi:hypothetical protein